MSTRIVYFDDITGEPNARPVRFGLDGCEYTVDLTEDRARELTAMLAPYIEAGRLVSRLVPLAKRKGHKAATRAADVRAWAKANGYAVNPMGAIPKALQRAYDFARADADAS